MNETTVMKPNCYVIHVTKSQITLTKCCIVGDYNHFDLSFHSVFLL